MLPNPQLPPGINTPTTFKSTQSNLNQDPSAPQLYDNHPHHKTLDNKPYDPNTEHNTPEPQPHLQASPNTSDNNLYQEDFFIPTFEL